MKNWADMLNKIRKRIEIIKLKNKFGKDRSSEYYGKLVNIRTKYDGPQDAIGFGKDFEKYKKEQFELLKKQGLLPKHKMLEIGCGYLRSGIESINYLNKGNYYGCDISEEIIKRSIERIKNKNLEMKNPTIINNKDLKFNEFNTKFDFIFSFSVFTHIPAKDIKECMENIHKIMHKSTIFIATFFKSDDYECKDVSSDISFRYPLEFFSKLCSKYGLVMEEINYGYPTSQCILRFKKSKIF